MGQKVVLGIVTAFKSAATRNVVFSTTLQNNKTKSKCYKFFFYIIRFFCDKG